MNLELRESATTRGVVGGVTATGGFILTGLAVYKVHSNSDPWSDFGFIGLGVAGLATAAATIPIVASGARRANRANGKHGVVGTVTGWTAYGAMVMLPVIPLFVTDGVRPELLVATQSVAAGAGVVSLVAFEIPIAGMSTKRVAVYAMPGGVAGTW